jgi:uncharacterized protein (DUF1330 family)
MIYLTQLIYIKEGQEAIFDQFEDIAIPAIEKYNGRLLVRVRPDEHSFIGDQAVRPYEIHLVEFNSEEDFQNFNLDEERKRLLHLKEQSVRTVFLIKGVRLG